MTAGDAGPPTPVPSRLPVARLVAEFFVIVTGVLVALGAQAWYEGREEAEREIDALRAVRADLIRTEQEVSRIRLDEFDNLEDIRATLQVLWGRGQPPDDWGDRTAPTFSRLYIALGALETLISTGDARLLRSPELRGRLIDYYDREIATREWAEHLDGGFVDRASRYMDSLETLAIESGTVPLDGTAGVALDELPLDRVRRSAGIRGFFLFQEVTVGTRTRIFREVIRRATALRLAIEEEFGARGIAFEAAPEVPISEPGAEGLEP